MRCSKKGLFPASGDKHPGKDPKQAGKLPAPGEKPGKDLRINANKDLPNVGFKCRICNKKYVNKKTEDLAPDEQNHGYAFAADGSGPCKCPSGAANPDKVAEQQNFLRNNFAKNQKK